MWSDPPPFAVDDVLDHLYACLQLGEFKCVDICMNCGYEETANNTEQLMPKLAAHAKAAHGMSEVPKEIMGKISAAIKDI